MLGFTLGQIAAGRQDPAVPGCDFHHAGPFLVVERLQLHIRLYLDPRSQVQDRWVLDQIHRVLLASVLTESECYRDRIRSAVLGRWNGAWAFIGTTAAHDEGPGPDVRHLIRG